jgi:tRNA dimethylallyltransferase
MQKLITILGPTACGKTPLAVALALRTGGEIISADSRQVYRRMDIGTGKDLSEYTVPTSQLSTVNCQLSTVLSTVNCQLSTVNVPYHLIDICEPGTKYNLFQYLQDFHAAYDDICSRGRQPILCGGTGLYIEAVLKDYQLSPVPQNQALRDSLEGKSLEELTAMLKELKAKNGTVMHNTTDVDTAQRAIRAIEIEAASTASPPTPLQGERGVITSGAQKLYTPLSPARGAGGEAPGGEAPGGEAAGAVCSAFGLLISRDLRREKITRRLKARLEEGMIDEVRGLLDSGIAADDLIYYGLEYKYVTEYVTGRISYEEMFRQLEIAIHQFAKRQMTWFRGMERRGISIHWIDATLPMEEKVEMILAKCNDV